MAKALIFMTKYFINPIIFFLGKFNIPKGFDVFYDLFRPAGANDGVKDFLYENGIGCIAFSPLAQGILTGKYLKGIPIVSSIGVSGSGL